MASKFPQYVAKNLNMAEKDVALKQVLPQRDVDIQEPMGALRRGNEYEGALTYIQKVKNDHDIYFFANSSSKAIDTKVVLRGKKALRIWNPHTGGQEAAELTESEANGQPVTTVRLGLPFSPSRNRSRGSHPRERHIIRDGGSATAVNGLVDSAAGHRIRRAFCVPSAGGATLGSDDGIPIRLPPRGAACSRRDGHGRPDQRHELGCRQGTHSGNPGTDRRRLQHGSRQNRRGHGRRLDDDLREGAADVRPATGVGRVGRKTGPSQEEHADRPGGWDRGRAWDWHRRAVQA